MRVHPYFASRATPDGPFGAHVLDRVAADLEAAAASRENQLNALPAATTLVAHAHRDSVQRILNAIRAAQAQLVAGTYGSCHRCGRWADPEAVLARPWAPLCADHQGGRP